MSDTQPVNSAEKQATIGSQLEAGIHRYFTNHADDLYAAGIITRDERITLSSGIGDALGAFVTVVERDAPGVYERPPWDVAIEEMRSAEAAGDAPGRVSHDAWVRSGFRAAVTKRDGDVTLTAADYAIVPDPEKPGTWKLRIDDAEHISGAIQALSPAGFRGKRVALEPGERKTAVGRIGAAIGRLPEDKRVNLVERLDAVKALAESSRSDRMAIKGDRFFLWSSNQFQDRTGEILRGESLKAFVDRIDRGTLPMPQADVWHVPGTEWGVAEMVDYVDGFLVTEGRITDPAVAAKIKAWGDKEELATSVHFWYPARGGLTAEGEYTRTDIDRVSVLPRWAAANPWGPPAMVDIEGGPTMGFAKAKRDALVELYDEEKVSKWEAQATSAANDLREKGVAFKGTDEGAFEVNVPNPTVTFVLPAAKDEGEAPAAVAPEAAPETAAAPAPASDEPPAWAAALGAKIDGLASSVTGIEGRVKSMESERVQSKALGVLGNSVEAPTDLVAQVLASRSKGAEEQNDVALMAAASLFGGVNSDGKPAAK